MNIGLIDVDGKQPNIALMKLSRWHKQMGDHVEFCNYIDHYDVVYKSKIFTFTPDDNYVLNADKVEKGGTGYDLHKTLPHEVDMLQPDYSLYPNIDGKTAYGFLTRGCPNHCKWCVVPQKEGGIRPYMDVDEIAIEGRTNLVLFDNNILACDYGIEQVEKIISRGYRVDFNQALDARLVTPETAKLLAKVKWIKRIRFGCDTPKQVDDCERAMELIDDAGYKGEYFLYCIIMELTESFTRINHWKLQSQQRYVVHAQPYRDFNNPRQVIPQWQKDLAHWADRKELFYSTDFADFEPRKGFKCKEYF